MEDNNWDLFAVVRGCSSAALPAADPFSGFRTPLPSLGLKETYLDGSKSKHFGFPHPVAASTSFPIGQLEEVCKPFYMELQQQPAPGLLPQQVRQHQEKLRPVLSPKSNYSSTACTATSLFPNIARVPSHFQEQTRLQPHKPNSSNPRNSKRRKNQLKKVVCQIPADGASSDLWAWRKYGQKPIKSSPYPRGYYRCSSSKGCHARKQVERSRADPAILIITYTAEHNHPVPTHRNSLAGSTRQKFPPSSSSAAQLVASSPSASGRTSQQFSSAYPPSGVTLSPTSPLAGSMQNALPLRTREPLKTNMTEVHEGSEEDGVGKDAEEAQHDEEEEEEEEELLTVGDVEMMGEEDMVFLGLEVLRDPAADPGTTQLPATESAISDFFKDEGGIEDHFFRSSWLPNNNATAAASGR